MAAKVYTLRELAGLVRGSGHVGCVDTCRAGNPDCDRDAIARLVEQWRRSPSAAKRWAAELRVELRLTCQLPYPGGASRCRREADHRGDHESIEGHWS